MNNQYSTTINSSHNVSYDDTSDASIALDTHQSKRDRSWRRFQAYKNKGKALSLKNKGNYTEHEKNWKLLYTRRVKLKRAMQLGKEYPKKTMRDLVTQELQHVID